MNWPVWILEIDGRPQLPAYEKRAEARASKRAIEGGYATHPSACPRIEIVPAGPRPNGKPELVDDPEQVPFVPTLGGGA